MSWFGILILASKNGYIYFGYIYVQFQVGGNLKGGEKTAGTQDFHILNCSSDRLNPAKGFFTHDRGDLDRKITSSRFMCDFFFWGGFKVYKTGEKTTEETIN